MANESTIKPLVLNLLVEEQLAEIKKARDPFKLSVAIAMMVLLATTVIGSVLGIQAEQKRKETNELARRLEQLTKASTVADSDALKISLGFCEDVMAMNRRRALYAPQLALIKELIPESIQLTRVSIGIVSEVQAPAAPPPGAETKPRRQATPPSTDYVNMIIDGQASGQRPEIEVDNFINAMRADPRLKDQVQHIQLRSVAPGAATAAGVAPNSAAFVIECRYKELPK